MLIREVQKPFSLVIQGKQFCIASLFSNTGNISGFTQMKETKPWFSKNLYQLKQATGTRFWMNLANFDSGLFRRHPVFWIFGLNFCRLNMSNFKWDFKNQFFCTKIELWSWFEFLIRSRCEIAHQWIYHCLNKKRRYRLSQNLTLS